MNNSVVQISLAEFKATVQTLHSAIFSGQEYSKVFEERYSPFINKSWEKILIPGSILMLDDPEFHPLASAANKMGDAQVFVTESESLPHYERTFRVDLNHEQLDKIRGISDVSHFELHAYGDSGTWGMMCYYDDFSLLGGNAAFMEAFFEVAGDRQRVKERFLTYATSEWFAVDPPTQIQIIKTVGWSFSDVSS